MFLCRRRRRQLPCIISKRIAIERAITATCSVTEEELLILKRDPNPLKIKLSLTLIIVLQNFYGKGVKNSVERFTLEISF